MANIDKILEKVKQEGDYKKFIHRGLFCEIRRNGDLGNLCGYVTIPMYSKLLEGSLLEEGAIDNIVSPHGGVTFNNVSKNGDYIIGFDCGHSGDLIPGMAKFSSFTNGVYRDMEYVENEVRQMANDIADADKTIEIQFREDKIDDIIN
jgi:hypothetical protein